MVAWRYMKFGFSCSPRYLTSEHKIISALRQNQGDYDAVKAGTHEGTCSRSTFLQHSPAARLPRLHQRFLAKKYVCATKLLLPSFCCLISNWFDMREQASGENLLHESVSGASWAQLFKTRLS